jgi:hypothetical protein
MQEDLACYVGANGRSWRRIQPVNDRYGAQWAMTAVGRELPVSRLVQLVPLRSVAASEFSRMRWTVGAPNDPRNERRATETAIILG